MTPLPDELRDVIQDMLWSLECDSLEVILVPSRKGEGMIRQVVNQNPEWYRSFCAAHTANRKRPKIRRKHHDTKIKRRNVVRTLARWLSRGVSESLYAEDLLSIARWEKVRQEDQEAAREVFYEDLMEEEVVPF